MRRIINILLALVLSVCTFALTTSCKKNKEDANPTHIVVGASATPHAEILEQCKPLLKEKGYTLEIVIYDDYVLPNTAVEDGDLDAN